MIRLVPPAPAAQIVGHAAGRLSQKRVRAENLPGLEEALD